MIISCSRRTDIPALYSEWFKNRIKAGFCIVPNPFNTNQLSTVSLKKQVVDAIVFWSKNPEPMLPQIEMLKDKGYIFYFQYTLNNYPKMIEPSLPSLANRLETFESLSKMLGPWGAVWRYDPIIISSETPYSFHENNFTMLCTSLKGMTSRVVISIVDWYQKTTRRINENGLTEIDKTEELPKSKDMLELLETLAAIAKSYGLEIQTCAESENYENLGITKGKCIDDFIINKLGGTVSYKKDKGQREKCLCTKSRDIGINNTCTQGCTYCYATKNNTLARRRYSEHNPESPVLS
ncbi:MAG: DUF1848 domain-containing protein [Deltaproteobacteria bacterium]|nr:DUF1848 domain-containing protein [Deltaproteobacteria bacterium]